MSASLHERFNPRRNHLHTIRLVLAMAVAVTHAMDLGFSNQPGIRYTNFSDLAVDAFFVLSGYLLAGSFIRLGSIRRYAWHRFLRIMPGFWVCLSITALVVAPVIAVLQGRAATSVFTGEESSIDFLVANSTLLIRQFGISGLPADVDVPDVMNGSLWTLFYEALCYAAVVALGVVGALRRHPVLLLAVVGLIWVMIAMDAAGLALVSQERMPRFAFMFLLGSAMLVYATRIPIRGGLAAAGAVLVVCGLVWLPDYRAVAGPAFAYVCLWLAVVRPPKSSPKSDYSYGLYVYHWPIIQILAVTGATQLGEPVFIVLAVCLALCAAMLSWVVVEEPALRLKDAAWITRTWGRSKPRHRAERSWVR